MDYRQSAPLSLPQSPNVPFSEASRESTRTPTIADFSVPARWVLFGALLVSLFAVVALLAACRLLDARPDVWLILLVGAAAGLGVALRVYWWMIRELWTGLNVLGTVERITGAPAMQEPLPALPAPPPSLAVEVHHGEGGRRSYFYNELPGPPEAILDWTRAALAGQSLSYRLWTERFGYRVNKFGKKVALYEEFRKYITDPARRYALEQGTHSISLTDAGVDFFLDLSTKSASDLTPLLTQGDDQNTGTG